MDHKRRGKSEGGARVSTPFHLQFIWHPYTAIPAECTAPLYETDHTQTDRDTPAEVIFQRYRNHGTGTKSGASCGAATKQQHRRRHQGEAECLLLQSD